MSLIVRNLRSVREECTQLMKKKIKKIKRKNQYTNAYTFYDDVEKQGQTQCNNHLILIVQRIPKTIPNNNVFRLKTNIQFSLDINQDNNMGSLSIDPHSNNYQVIRTDRRKNLLILTLNQIDRPITPSEILHSIFSARNKHLADIFIEYENRNLDASSFKLNNMEEMVEFEKKLYDQPYACYVNVYKDGFWKTVQKVFSQELLKVYAVTEEMILNYCKETNLIPISAYFDPLDVQLSVFEKIFKGIIGQEKQYREYVNYNGERFAAYLKTQTFFIYDENNDQYVEYQYFVTECDNKWMSQERIKNNELEYFNLKQCSTITEESSYQELQKRCGVKSIQG